MEEDNAGERADKWLWAARFFKTRSLAQEALEIGRILIDGQRIKASRLIRVGTLMVIRRSDEELEVLVKGLSEKRGSASEASLLYEETESSRSRRQMRKEAFRMAMEPSATIRGGRPTKREGRRLRALKWDG